MTFLGLMAIGCGAALVLMLIGICWDTIFDSFWAGDLAVKVGSAVVLLSIVAGAIAQVVA